MVKIRKHVDGTSKNVHLAGWRRQASDPRDEEFRLKLNRGFLNAARPIRADLRSVCSPIEDQGDLGSCTANMFAGIIEANDLRAHGAKFFVERKGVASNLPTVTVSNVATNPDGSVTFATSVAFPQPQPPAPTPGPAPTPPPAPPSPTPSKLIHVSRLFEYYATRTIEGTVNQDSGASIRDTIKAGAKYGCLDEALWPYQTPQFAVKPPDALWKQALTHTITSYHSIADGDLESMKVAIASGYLVGFGFNVYDYFLSQDMAQKGVLSRPKPTETLQGGHAVCLVGFDDARKQFLVRNSWGANWGLAGYFWMDYDYVGDSSLAGDFWVVASAPL